MKQGSREIEEMGRAVRQGGEGQGKKAAWPSREHRSRCGMHQAIWGLDFDEARRGRKESRPSVKWQFRKGSSWSARGG